MKRLLYSLTFLTCFWAQAQLHIDFEVANQTNQIFGQLDKSKIPHHMLLDYGYDFIDVPNYDGVLRDNNYIVPSVYRDLYNSVVSMRTTLTVPQLVDPLALEESWKSTNKTETAKLGKGALATAVAVNGLYYQYARFRQDALEQGLIEVVDGQFYKDVYTNTEWKNPYETKEVFAMSLPFTQIGNSKISLVLGEADWRTNQAILVKSFAVDFGDGGGFEPMELDKSIGHYFEEDGDYVFTFRLELANGTYKYCRTPVKITGKAKQQTLTARNPDCDENPWEETITATKAYMGAKGVAKLQIAPAKECTKIHKPLIVVEGFDSGLTQDDPIYGDTHLKSFLRDILDSENDVLQNLITEDTEESFDIIYVNWADGTDWLQRNAYALEAVIQWVNDIKEEDAAPNVILGQSMGGVVARYALRDMENNNLDHDTSLYISHDAPHQGAHVPLGFLAMARHVVNELIATPIGGIAVAIASGQYPVNDARQLIDRPAVKQMLINYVDSNYKINNDVHKAWQEELKAMGYPQQTWNVALSNGSHCAQPYGMEPGQTLFRLYGSGATSPGTDILTFMSFKGALVGAAMGDIPAALLGFLPGQTKLKLDFHVWASPGGESNWLYKGWIQYEKKHLWLIPIMRTITNRTFSWEGSNLFLENMPGGTMPFINTINEFENYGDNFFASYNLNLEVAPASNFISTTSALDVGSNNVLLQPEDYLRTYTMNTPLPEELTIPFNNFATTYNVSGLNAPHVSFNRSNGDWLANELQEATTILDCTFLCSNQNKIEGSDILCDQEIYYVDVPGDAQVQWSSSDPDVATPTDPNSAATSFTTLVNTFQQEVTLIATLTSQSCGGDPVVLQKVVQVGRPGLPSSLSGPEIVLTGALVNYTGGPAEGAEYYEWWLPHPFEKVDQFDYFGDNWQVLKTTTYYDIAQVFTGYAENEGYVQLMGVNECGKGGAKTLYVRHAKDGELGEGGIPLQQDPVLDVKPPVDDGNDGLVLYPNIAKDEVKVTVVSPTMTEVDEPTKIQGITLYAQLQQIPKKRLSYPNPGVVSATLNISDLVTGYYFMVIETNRGPITKILLVK